LRGIRIFPVGRLDRNTTGVLLLTNDGELASKLTHPKFGVTKVYEVKTAVNVTDDQVERLLKGVELDDGLMKVDSLIYPDTATRQLLQIEIHSGKNRIIRRMFEHLGIEIVKLDRISFAGLTKKNLARGRWRYLTAREVGWLKMMR
jgi:23S rRNA pseudouridine2605 synthase